MSGSPTGPTVPTRAEPTDGGHVPPGSWDPGGDGGAPAARHGVGWGLTLIAAGTLWMLTLAGVSIRWELLLPAALIVVGLLVLGLPRGRDGGVVGLGVALLVATMLMVVLPGSASLTAGDRSHAIADAADLEDDYQLGAGTLILDLGELELTEATEVSASVGMGELLVRVPADVRVLGEARVGLGEIEHFGDATGGVAPTVDLDGPGAGDAPTLTLDLRVGLGQIEVER